MVRGRRLKSLELSSGALTELTSFAGSRSLPHGLVRRAKIVLLCAEGLSNTTVAEKLNITRATVGTWRERYRLQGLPGLYDELRPGKPRSIVDEEIAELLRRTIETKPVGGTHWSCRSLAAETGISKSTVQRVWSAFGLQPHRQKHFKLSTDPFFVDKVHDIVGLYLNPPDNAMVLCVDEKSQAQALERTQPLLPIGARLCRGRHTRLQASRHDHPVRSARRGHRRSDAGVQAATSSPGVSPVPQTHRPERPRRSGHSSRRRQLCDAQAPQNKALVSCQTQIPHSLHANILVLVKPSRNLVQHHYPKSHPSRLIQIREESHRQNQRLHRPL